MLEYGEAQEIGEIFVGKLNEKARNKYKHTNIDINYELKQVFLVDNDQDILLNVTKRYIETERPNWNWWKLNQTYTSLVYFLPHHSKPLILFHGEYRNNKKYSYVDHCRSIYNYFTQDILELEWKENSKQQEAIFIFENGHKERTKLTLPLEIRTDSQQYE